MKKLSIVLIVILFITSCQSKQEKSEIFLNIFTEEEREDIDRLVSFFEKNFIPNLEQQDSCYKDWIINYPEINNPYEIDSAFYGKQVELLRSINSNLLEEIWEFTNSRNLKTGREYQSIVLLQNGKYYNYLKALAQNNQQINQYFNMVELEGDLPSIFHLSQMFSYIDHENETIYHKGNYCDYDIKVLIAINTIDEVDDRARFMNWIDSENDFLNRDLK